MRGLVNWLAKLLFFLCIAAELGAQQGKRPMMREFFINSPQKWDETLPWMSEYAQPAIYKEWWKEIATCEGFPVPPESITSKVQFFQVNAQDFVPGGLLLDVLAVTYDEGDRKTYQTFVGNPYIWQKGLIEHEMLHVILSLNGFQMGNEHPPELFETCGLHTMDFQ